MAHGLRPIYQTGDDGEDIDIDDIECAADKTRMMPLRDRASDGRVPPAAYPVSICRQTTPWQYRKSDLRSALT
jgi:hypothetical protein